MRPADSANLTEAAFKAAYLNHARATGQIGKRTALANEFVLGNSGVRADLAIFGDEIAVVEIKTARDSLRRLEGQLRAYRQLCGRVILVLAERHVQSALARNIDDVEVWSLSHDGSLVLQRPALLRPATVDASPLLTQAERRRLQLPGPIDQMTAARVVGQRFSAASTHFWATVGSRKIRPEHLETLSRFKSIRELESEHLQRQSEMWADWERQASQVFATPNAPHLNRPTPRRFGIGSQDLQKTPADAGEY